MGAGDLFQNEMIQVDGAHVVCALQILLTVSPAGLDALLDQSDLQALDAAVRGLAVGDKATIKVIDGATHGGAPKHGESHCRLNLRCCAHAQAQGKPWKRELLFAVPREHPEMQRLDGRYKKWAGPFRTLMPPPVPHAATSSP